MKTTLCIHGAAGRMGRRLTALAHDDPDLTMAAATEAPGSPHVGEDAGALAGIGEIGVAVSDVLAKKVDVIIDFTIPAGTQLALHAAEQTKSALLIGTTGLSDEDHRQIQDAASVVAVLQAPNMSLGVNLLFALAAQVAKQLGDDYDIEVVESHHRFKKDAPSGTAMGIVESICGATGRDVRSDVIYGRQGGEATRQGREIGVHALRLGDVVGKHTVSFGALGEVLELGHTATSRDVFVRGALRAAKWLAGKPAGRYHMADVLGL